MFLNVKRYPMKCYLFLIHWWQCYYRNPTCFTSTNHLFLTEQLWWCLMMPDVGLYEIFIDLDLLETSASVREHFRSVWGMHFSFFRDSLACLEAFLCKKYANVKNKNSRLYQTKIDHRFRCVRTFRIAEYTRYTSFKLQSKFWVVLYGLSACNI